MTPVQIIFLITAAVAVVSALMVVVSHNLVRSALWLVVTLFAVAVLFVLLEAGFLAVVQVVLYIGAIAILIIFAVMLTRRVMHDAGPQTNRQWWGSALAAAILFVALLGLLAQLPWPGAAAALTTDMLPALGRALVDPNQFVLPFEVASVLLLAALVGAIVIAGEK